MHFEPGGVFLQAFQDDLSVGPQRLIQPRQCALCDVLPQHLIDGHADHFLQLHSGSEIVARQRELAAKGKMGSASRELLELFERTQDIFENDLARLVAERKK